MEKNMNQTMRTAAIAVVGAVTVVGLTPGSAFARQRGGIRFARGASSKTVTATAEPFDPDCWTYIAKEGQRVRASVTSARGNALLVLDPFNDGNEYNDLQIQVEEQGMKSDSFELYRSGTQDVCVGSIDGRSATYKLKLTIV
jgi:hypothetical protein